MDCENKESPSNVKTYTQGQKIAKLTRLWNERILDISNDFNTFRESVLCNSLLISQFGGGGKQVIQQKQNFVRFCRIIRYDKPFVHFNIYSCNNFKSLQM